LLYYFLVFFFFLRFPFYWVSHGFMTRGSLVSKVNSGSLFLKNWFISISSFKLIFLWNYIKLIFMDKGFTSSPELIRLFISFFFFTVSPYNNIRLFDNSYRFRFGFFILFLLFIFINLFIIIVFLSILFKLLIEPITWILNFFYPSISNIKKFFFLSRSRPRAINLVDTKHKTCIKKKE